MMLTRPDAAGELVPLADRMRYMLALRVVVAVGVLLAIPIAHERLYEPEQAIVATTACFAAFAFAGHGAWRLARRRGAAVFGLMLAVDGAFLAWAAYATGGAGSPVRYLIVLELLAVALLASYRTGLKLALWQSLLVVTTHQAQEGGVLPGFEPEQRTNLVGEPWEQTVAFVVVLWVVAVATASFSAVNERELRRRRFDLESLARLTAKLERESEPRGVAGSLLATVVGTFGFRRGLVLGGGEDASFVPLATHGSADPSTGEGDAGPGSVVKAAALSHSTELVSELDPAADAWLDAVLPEARNLIVLPLSAEGGTVGALIVEHDARPGSRIERRLVKTVERFAAHGALALRNANLLAEVRELAASDALTKLANRTTFAEALDRELARAQRDGGEVTLVMVDIDHFKQLNDTRGHPAGDEVLRRVAATLREQRRAYDVAARYGGEEFALLAPGLTTGDAAAAGERIRRAIAANGCGVTASVGVASYPRDAGGADALVAAADAALYRSKREGRDRVTQADARGARASLSA